jgi:hypothetical protein
MGADFQSSVSLNTTIGLNPCIRRVQIKLELRIRRIGFDVREGGYEFVVFLVALAVGEFSSDTQDESCVEGINWLPVKWSDTDRRIEEGPPFAIRVREPLPSVLEVRGKAVDTISMMNARGSQHECHGN